MFSLLYIANYTVYKLKVDSKVCRICFHKCWFLGSEREVDLKKM